MLIRCPKCDTSYDIGSATIPAEGKKVRCSQCNEIWVCLLEVATETEHRHETAPQLATKEVLAPLSVDVPADPKPEIPVEESKPEIKAPKEVQPAKNAEMQEIFARLETQTQSLFNIEKNLPPHRKVWRAFKRLLGLQHQGNRRLIATSLLVLSLLTLFYLRYEIVRVAPFMERFYTAFHIDSVIPGEGLEFQNITRNEYEEDYVSKMEIRGFITNVTGKTLEIPTVQIQLLDKNVQPLQIIHQDPPVVRIIAGSKVGFRIIITKPSKFSKYVFLTFTRERPADTVKAVSTRPAKQ